MQTFLKRLFVFYQEPRCEHKLITFSGFSTTTLLTIRDSCVLNTSLSPMRHMS